MDDEFTSDGIEDLDEDVEELDLDEDFEWMIFLFSFFNLLIRILINMLQNIKLF